MKKLNKKGFTLVELVIVIAVIAILAAVLIPTFSGVVEKANKNADLQAARNAMTNYYASLEASGLEAMQSDVLVFKGKTYFYTIEKNEVNTTAYGSAGDAITATGMTCTTNTLVGTAKDAAGTYKEFLEVNGIDGLYVYTVYTIPTAPVESGN